MTKRIFKSLTVIMLFLMFGWLFNAGMRTMFIFIDADLLTVNYAGLYGGLLVNITIASNAYILYLFRYVQGKNAWHTNIHLKFPYNFSFKVFSYDYRKALNQELNFFSRRLTGKSVVYMTNVEDLQSSNYQKRHSTITIKDI